MKHLKFLKSKLIVLSFVLPISLLSQIPDEAIQPAQPSFWDHVQFGGGLGASFGSNYSSVSISPQAIYNFNRYFAAGVGLLGSWASEKNYYTSTLLGGNIIGLINPIPQIQLSVSLNQVHANNKYEISDSQNFTDSFWSTGLFLGIGYRASNVTIGMNYNVLYDEDKDIYGDAFMPFVRVFF